MRKDDLEVKISPDRHVQCGECFCRSQYLLRFRVPNIGSFAVCEVCLMEMLGEMEREE